MVAMKQKNETQYSVKLMLDDHDIAQLTIDQFLATMYNLGVAIAINEVHNTLQQIQKQLTEKVKMIRWQQNQNQYGFTKNISYLIGALQRHETAKYCFDNKLTFFGSSLKSFTAQARLVASGILLNYLIKTPTQK